MSNEFSGEFQKIYSKFSEWKKDQDGNPMFIDFLKDTGRYKLEPKKVAERGGNKILSPRKPRMGVIHDYFTTRANGHLVKRRIEES